MAKFSGVVGYGEQQEIPADSGVFKDVITEIPYFGDVLRNSRQMREGEDLNKVISVQNSISIVADAYANEHIFAMRFVMWQGTPWTISDVTVEFPRLILRLGEVYNGPRQV